MRKPPEKISMDILETMPKMGEIPDEFKYGHNKWCKFVSTWFFQGIQKGFEATPKEGVDRKLALRHIGAILSSWDPKHEHKEAAAAYLMSEYFSDIGKYEPRKTFDKLLGG